MPEWNSNQYLMFKNERTQPAIDLVNRITISAPKKVLDIGCGPGNSTEILYKKFPDAYILGVDNSKDMINSAKKNYPSLDFKILNVSTELSKLSGDFDVVFSNACIQWIPNHKNLLKNLLALLNPNGILAVQIPMNYNEPIHKIISEVSTNSRWKKEFDNSRIFYTLEQEEYFDLLSDISENFCIWSTTYCHRLKSHKDIMEWYKGTGLRPYLEQLSEEKKISFENDIFKEVTKRYKLQKNGEIIFRFPRFFFIATPKAN